MPFSDGTEAQLVRRLREDGDLVLSLVACAADGAIHGEILGHVGFSPVTVDGGKGNWFQLAPLAVAPGRQREGIGTALVREGIARMKDAGARGIGVLGDPRYYGGFGFAPCEGLGISGPHGDYFRWLALTGEPPRGEVRFAPAFG